MSAVDTARSVVSHRGISCLELHRKLGELQRKVRQLTVRAEQANGMEARLDEQAKTIDSLRDQLTRAKQIRDDVHTRAARYDEAEAQRQLAVKELVQAENAIRLRDSEITDLKRKVDIGVKAEHVVAKTQELDPEEVRRMCTPVPLAESPLTRVDPAQLAAVKVQSVGLLRAVTDPGRVVVPVITPVLPVSEPQPAPCAECTTPVPAGTTFCSARCRNAADRHDTHNDYDLDGDES